MTRRQRRCRFQTGWAAWRERAWHFIIWDIRLTARKPAANQPSVQYTQLYPLFPSPPYPNIPTKTYTQFWWLTQITKPIHPRRRHRLATIPTTTHTHIHDVVDRQRRRQWHSQRRPERCLLRCHFMQSICGSCESCLLTRPVTTYRTTSFSFIVIIISTYPRASASAFTHTHTHTAMWRWRSHVGASRCTNTNPPPSIRNSARTAQVADKPKSRPLSFRNSDWSL